MGDLESPRRDDIIPNAEFRDDTSVEPLIPDQTIEAIQNIKHQCKKLKLKEVFKRAKIDITVGEVNIKIQDLKITGQIN
ncbi:MAG: hypothetical protein LWX54_03095 [Deltaproteobacteria bacterium]|jgi:hypothetical protein|nr:hypothetical protein [Deltaproteobacteria bacterium]